MAELTAAVAVHTPEQVGAAVRAALAQAPFSGVGCVLEWLSGVASDAPMWEALVSAKLTPDACILLELGDDAAVARLFAAAPTATLKDAETKLERERALAALTVQVEAEEEEDGPLKTLFAADDQAAIEARAAELIGTWARRPRGGGRGARGDA